MNSKATMTIALALVVAATCVAAAEPVAKSASAGAGVAAATAPAATGAMAAKPGSAAGPSPVAKTVLAAMDPKADPCQDFYRYACGGWVDATKVPSDQSRWSRSFSEITERNRVVLREILDEAAENPGNDPDTKRIGQFYSTCMDEAAIESAGIKPLEPLFAEVDRIKDTESLMKSLARLHRASVPAFFGMAVVGDFKNPDLNLAYMAQGGLGLPDRDYYLKDDDRSKDIRQAYEAHIARMLALTGTAEDAAKSTAASIVAFETKLAQAARPRAELRNPEKTYNKLDRAGLEQLTPALSWTAYFAATGHPDITSINVQVPEYIKAIEGLVTDEDKSALKAYLRWAVLRSNAPHLTKALVDENFAFYGKKLGGQQEIQARWKRCTAATDNALGEILGKKFVDREFAGASKTTALEMLAYIQRSFGANLGNLSWMDDATRARAKEKLDALGRKIGYPDKWEDYSKLNIKADSWFGNIRAAREWAFDKEAVKVGKPVDKLKWGMSPPTVNAYYTPLLNEMVFPAGILQPPFFNGEFPVVMNFGGIGMVMGHELSHGFDDSGRKFDPKGRLTEWWEPSVSAKFEERASCVDDFYSSYEPFPGVKMNGKLGLGENIADLGGVKQSFAAWKAYEKDHPGLPGTVPGLTNDQLFFVAFAQGWCTVATEEQERNQVISDPHALPRYRVAGPLMNSTAFAATFSCPAGSPMNPEKKCEVW